MNRFAELAALAAVTVLAVAPSTLALESKAGRRVAQAAPATQTPPLRPSTPEPAAAKPPPPAPTRTEILNFDNWAVTCNEFAEGPSSRRCAAILRIVQEKTNQAVFAWSVAIDANKQATAVVETPSGVNLAPGVELRIGKVPAHKFPFTSCEPNFCVAKSALDAAFLHEMVTTSTAEAIIQGSQGNEVRFSIQMKGFDRAYAALTR